MTIGIVGLGYVGLPAGRRVRRGRRASDRRRHERGQGGLDPSRGVLHRGHPVGAARRRPPAAGGHHAHFAPGARRRDHHRRPDPADREPRAGPRPAARRRPVRLGRAPGRPARRPRVHDLPGDHSWSACSRSWRRLDCRRGSTSTSPSRPSASIRATRSSRSRTRRRSSAASPPLAPRRPKACTASVCEVDRARHHPRGGRDGEAAREHLPQRQHRPVNELRHARRAHGRRHLGGSSTPRRPSRSATCASSRAPAWAATACRSTPFYLSWKAREYDFSTEFIELAGKVQPEHAVRLRRACRAPAQRARQGRSRLPHRHPRRGLQAVVGDIRESPSLKIIERLQSLGGNVVHHDEFVAELKQFGLASTSLADALDGADIALIAAATRASTTWPSRRSCPRSTTAGSAPLAAARRPDGDGGPAPAGQRDRAHGGGGMKRS